MGTTPRPWPTLVPGLARLGAYRRSWLRGDVLAGVTVAAYLVPQVMAYAEVAGLPAVAGLWTTAAALLVYAVLGSSPQLSVGPESTTALMTAVALTGVAAGDPSRYAANAAVLALLVGAISLASRLARLGFLSDLVSRPVLVGYLAGVAVVMAASQLGKVTGMEVPGETFLAQVGYVAGHLELVHGPTLAVAAAALAVLVVLAVVLPRAPGPLLVMVAAAGVAAWAGLEGRGVSLVGEIPAGLPPLGLPSFDEVDVVALLPAALGIAVVGFSDNILTGRAFATRAGYRLDSNQELLALGAANVAAGTVGGFPVSSSGSRTAIGDAMGSRTQLHSIVALVSVVAALALFGPVLAAFPRAALGAVVVYAAARLIDFAGFRRIAGFRRVELLLAVVTTAAVLGLGVLQGVIVAVALSTLEMLHRVSRPHDGILGHVPGLAGMHDVDDYPAAKPVPGLVVYRYDSPLFFANAQDFLHRALEAVDGAPTEAHWLLLNAEANVMVDVTAVDALEELLAECRRRGVVLALARVKQDLRDDLEHSGFLAHVGEERVFPTLPTAVEGYVVWHSSEFGRMPTGFEPGRPPGLQPPAT